MTDTPQGIDNLTRETSKSLGPRVETPDGKRVFLFRYENPQAPRESSGDSRDQLVGSWFTDSPKNLKTYIKARPPGGNIVVVEVGKDRLEELKAVNHPSAGDMDIEPLDNYIIPQELLEGASTIPFPVATEKPKFQFGDWDAVNSAVDEIVDKLLSSDEKPKEDLATRKARIDSMWSTWDEVQKVPELVSLFDRKTELVSEKDPQTLLQEHGYPPRTRIADLDWDKWKADLNPKFIKDGFMYLLRGDYPHLAQKGFYSRPFGYDKQSTGQLTSELHSSDEVGYFLHRDERYLTITEPRSDSIAEQLAYLQSAMGGSSFISATTNIEAAIAGTGNQPTLEEQAGYEVYVIKIPVDYIINSNTGNHFGMNEQECLIPDYVTPDEIVATFPRDQKNAIYQYMHDELGATREDLGLNSETT
jgi:hypothetical protein